MRLLIRHIVPTCLILMFCGNPAWCQQHEAIAMEEVENPLTRGAITMYWDYLSITSTNTLNHLHEKHWNEAGQSQDFVLKEMIVELGSSMIKYSWEQRRLVLDLFDRLDAYYAKNPWRRQPWYQGADADYVRRLAKADEVLQQTRTGTWDLEPEGVLAHDQHMVPLIRFRVFMAEVAMSCLDHLAQQDNATVVQQLEGILDRLIEAELDLHKLLQDEIVDYRTSQITKETLKRITDYREAHPRAQSDHFPALPAGVRARAEALEARLQQTQAELR